MWSTYMNIDTGSPSSRCYKDLNCIITVLAKIYGSVWDFHKLVEEHEINLAVKMSTVLGDLPPKRGTRLHTAR